MGTNKATSNFCCAFSLFSIGFIHLWKCKLYKHLLRFVFYWKLLWSKEGKKYMSKSFGQLIGDCSQSFPLKSWTDSDLKSYSWKWRTLLPVHLIFGWGDLLLFFSWPATWTGLKSVKKLAVRKADAKVHPTNHPMKPKKADDEWVGDEVYIEEEKNVEYQWKAKRSCFSFLGIWTMVTMSMKYPYQSPCLRNLLFDYEDGAEEDLVRTPSTAVTSCTKKKNSLRAIGYCWWIKSSRVLILSTASMERIW